MNIRTILSTMLFIFVLPIIGIFYIVGSKQLIIGACFISFMLYFLICGSNIKTHFLGFLFGVSCFGFLFGSFLFNKELLSTVGVDDLTRYCLSLSLSLLGIVIGLEIGSRRGNQNINNLKDYITDSRTKSVYSLVNKIFWITIPFSYVYALLRAYYAITYGYVYLYNNPEAFLSGSLSFITDISSINSAAYIILLSTLPKVFKVRKQTIALLIYYILLLLSGSRTGLFRILFLIVSYFFIMRHSYEGKVIPKKKIVKYIVIAIASIYVFSALFTNVVNMRTGTDYYSKDKSPIANLISSEGKTWKIVIDTFEVYKKTTVDQHLRYYFMPLINTATMQFVFQKVGLGFVQASPYTSEYAINSYDYSHYYTYISNPALYLSGGGLGSSYLAESFFFGQYLGVVFHSILIGIFLSTFLCKVNKSLLKNAYMWTFIYNIFWSPRGSALGPFFSFFSFSNLIIFIALYMYLGLIRRR